MEATLERGLVTSCSNWEIRCVICESVVRVGVTAMRAPVVGEDVGRGGDKFNFKFKFNLFVPYYFTYTEKN